jgi:hypothetical protein
MSKLVIPNVPNHYEGSGFEVDVTNNQIIIRTKGPEPERFHKERQKPQQQDPVIGPISTMLLKGIGFLK